MKKLFALLIISVLSTTTYSQSYLGWVTKQANFRESPSTSAPILSSLQAETEIFIVSLETENDFYNVIDIATNIEGYVHKSLVKIGEQVKENDQDVFTPSGESSSYNPDIEIFNDTDLNLTLKLNSETYYFSPKQKRTLTVIPGTINYRASAPGVIPNIGSEYLKSNQGYTWQFYIVTSY